MLTSPTPPSFIDRYSKPEYRPKGRPTKLTPERHRKIVEKVRAGAPLEVAGGVVGVGASTISAWVTRGERETNTDYSRFADDIANARAELESELAEKWVTIGRDYEDWRAIAEYLQRRVPERWMKKDAVELSGPNGKPIQVEGNPLPVDQLPVWAQQLLIVVLSGRKVSEDLERRIVEELGGDEKLLLGSCGDNVIDITPEHEQVEVESEQTDDDSWRRKISPLPWSTE